MPGRQRVDRRAPPLGLLVAAAVALVLPICGVLSPKRGAPTLPLPPDLALETTLGLLLLEAALLGRLVLRLLGGVRREAVDEGDDDRLDGDLGVELSRRREEGPERAQVEVRGEDLCANVTSVSAFSPSLDAELIVLGEDAEPQGRRGGVRAPG